MKRAKRLAPLAIAAVLAITASASRAQAPYESTTRYSDSTNGLSCFVQWAGGETLDASSSITYGFLSTNTAGVLLALPKEEYLCKIRCTSDKGVPVPRRRSQPALGARFADLKTYSLDKVQRLRGGPVLVRALPGGGVGHSLPAPAEVFDIKAPGRYQLELQFQVFEPTARGTNYSLGVGATGTVPWTLVTLPPLVISLRSAAAAPASGGGAH